jgi:type I restriction enzyme S subunit
MKSNYRELGQYIREVNQRNSDLAITNLLGVSMEKTFIRSVANLNGVDMSVYKVLKNEQLACKLMSVGRDEKLPVDLYREQEPSIVSSAYYVFEPKDKEELLPEYLMMWLCRPENDRYIGFISGGDVRGGISWDTFCSLPIKVPSISKQKEIVKEYNVIQNRIALNQQLIQKLEETAQAIYKAWFVEFEFPDENGKPYKSSGGEMVWSEDLGKEIPKGWSYCKIADLGYIKHGYAFKGEDFTENETSLLLVSPGNFKLNGGFNFEKNKYYTGKYPKSYILSENDLIVNMTDLSKNGDTLGNTALIPILNFKTLLHNQRVGKFELKNINQRFYLYFVTNQKDYKHYILGTATGTTVRHTSPDRIASYQIIIPTDKIIDEFNLIINPIVKLINLSPAQNYKLTELKELLLSRLATIEN